MTVSCQSLAIGRLGGPKCHVSRGMAAPALLLALCTTAATAECSRNCHPCDRCGHRGIPSGPTTFGGNGGGDRRRRSIRDTLPDAFGHRFDHGYVARRLQIAQAECDRV